MKKSQNLQTNGYEWDYIVYKLKNHPETTKEELQELDEIIKAIPFVRNGIYKFASIFGKRVGCYSVRQPFLETILL